MKVKTIILIIVILAIKNGICQESRFSPTYKVFIKPELGKIVLKQCSRMTPEKVKRFWTPSTKEIEILENNFKKIRKAQPVSPYDIDGEWIENFDDFGYQYIGITIKKKRYIYINAFGFNKDKGINKQFSDWKEYPVRVCDGGIHFWGVLFDLETLNFKEISFNGV